MEIIHTETNRGNKAVIFNDMLYRKKMFLKNGDIVYVCSTGKNCNMSLTTEKDGLPVTKMKNSHTCGNNGNTQKSEECNAKNCRKHNKKNCRKRKKKLLEM